MYPYEIIFGLTLYDILIAAGVAAAILLFSYLADKRGIKKKLQSLVMACTLCALAGGWFFVYFIGGKFAFKKTENPRYYLTEFFTVADIAACCVCAAHALGRFGCLFAGCCHGKVYAEKRPFTVPLLTLSVNGEVLWTEYTVPVQLYEALFLLALGTIFFFRALRKKTYGLPLYLALYGAWRFCIEFARADDRGATVVSFLSPSQLVALLLIAVAAAVFYTERRCLKLRRKEEDEPF